MAKWYRLSAIHDAWDAWQADVEREEQRSGYKAATAVYEPLSDEHQALLAIIVRTHARTVDGLLAKARACDAVLLPAEGFTREIDDAIPRYGVDSEIASFSIARDALELVKGEAS